jgi:hypothetical protein
VFYDLLYPVGQKILFTGLLDLRMTGFAWAIEFGEACLLMIFLYHRPSFEQKSTFCHVPNNSCIYRSNHGRIFPIIISPAKHDHILRRPSKYLFFASHEFFSQPFRSKEDKHIRTADQLSLFMSQSDSLVSRQPPARPRSNLRTTFRTHPDSVIKEFTDRPSRKPGGQPTFSMQISNPNSSTHKSTAKSLPTFVFPLAVVPLP